MDITDYDVDPDSIMTGLRTIIENGRDDEASLRYDVMTWMQGGYAIPKRIVGYKHKRSSTRRHKLPAWMKDPTLLPKAPPSRRIEEDDAT